MKDTLYVVVQNAVKSIVIDVAQKDFVGMNVLDVELQLLIVNV